MSLREYRCSDSFGCMMTTMSIVPLHECPRCGSRMMPFKPLSETTPLREKKIQEEMKDIFAGLDDLLSGKDVTPPRSDS